MRSARVIVVTLVFAASAFLVAAPLRAAESYEAMVARLKAGDAKIDYGVLRDTYAESANYQPYGGDFDDMRTAMIKAYNANDCKTTLANAAKVLEVIYIDVVSHLLSARCHETAGDAAKANFHRSVGRGIFDAILATGDGKSAKTAFAVVTINEEYDVLGLKGLSLKQQSLANDGGHVYDRMEVTSETGEAMTLYFQIDRPMRFLSKSMGPK